MSKKKNYSSACQINTLSKEQNKISNIGKSFIITEDQIRSLFVEFTSSTAFFETLIKVINNDEFWVEFENAKEHYYDTDDEDFKKEYENLKNSCKEDEIVVYQYTPFTLQQMLETTENKINIYLQENDCLSSWTGIDSELANLFLLKDIVNQNI